MNKKTLYLFLALALPGLIFVFLKFFGKNEFEVQVYYQDGLPPDSICNSTSNTPYAIADSVFKRIGAEKKSGARIIAVYPFIKDDLSELNRMAGKYKPDGVETIIISGMPNLPKAELPVTQLNYDSFGWIVACAFRVSEPWSVVLLDEQNRIRGYYDGSRRDEMDRLDLELSIILKSVGAPADAYMVLRLSELSGRSHEDVLRYYQANKHKGWGVIAKDLGVKPGSSEFKALKGGHDMRDFDDSRDDRRDDRDRDQDHGKEHGKGKH